MLTLVWNCRPVACNALAESCAALTNVLLSWCRSTEELQETGTVDVLFGTFWRLPFIYVAMFLARAASIAFFKPLFDCAGTGAVTAAVYVQCANLQGWYNAVCQEKQFRCKSLLFPVSDAYPMVPTTKQRWPAYCFTRNAIALLRRHVMGRGPVHDVWRPAWRGVSHPGTDSGTGPGEESVV